MVPASNNRAAITLVELLVVLVIIAILLGLLFPAVLRSREMARIAACQGNLHQLAVALTHFVEARRKLPDVTPTGSIGGWAIAILPFMEDTNLADGFASNTKLDPAAPPPLAQKRPIIMTCPSGYEGESSVATIPASHYSAIFIRHSKPDRNQWTIGELQLSSRIPWIVSPEEPIGGSAELLPHRTGFNSVSGYGGTAQSVIFQPAAKP